MAFLPFGGDRGGYFRGLTETLSGIIRGTFGDILNLSFGFN
jgi:hypothetical protein